MNLEIKILIPNNNVFERLYIIETIFHDFIGINHIVELVDEIDEYHLLFENKRIIVKDSFWCFHKEINSYLDINNLPNVHYVKNQFILEENIPVLYGDGGIDILENEIYCDIDFFAGSFFMLTRWEEYVNKERDNHDRFPAYASNANNHNYLNRPVVNEYIEMLWNMFLHLGYKGERKKRSFEIILTHDIDILKSSNTFRSLLGDIIKRKSLSLALHNLFSFFYDPVNSFNFLMDVSERIGVKSRFFFMSVHPETITNNPKNYLKSLRFNSLIKEIIKRGHVIGFHPGYFTYMDNEQWLKEKSILEDAIGFKVNEGRQHYLKLDITETLNIWDYNGMNIDYSLGYADKEGYRCGTGDSFYIFDFIRRKKLQLKETPLVLMDGSLTTYQSLDAEVGREIIEKYLNLGKKYRMKTVLLFHNSSFDRKNWKGWKSMYENVLIKYKSEN